MLVIVVSCIALLQPAAAADWSLCRKVGAGAMNVTDVQIVPDPIQAGAPAKFQIFTENLLYVEAGILTASVRYLGFQVYKKSGDFCVQATCPMTPGSTVMDLIEQMPPFLPPGKMVLSLHAKRSDNVDLFCVDINLASRKGKDASQRSDSKDAVATGVHRVDVIGTSMTM